MPFEFADEDIPAGAPARFENITPEDRQRVIDAYGVKPVPRYQFADEPPAPAKAAAPKPRFTPEWAAKENAKDQPSAWDPITGTANELLRKITPDISAPAKTLGAYNKDLGELEDKLTPILGRAGEGVASAYQKFRTGTGAVFSLLPPVVNEALSPIMEGMQKYSKAGLVKASVPEDWATVISEFVPDLAMILAGGRLAKMIKGADVGNPRAFMEQARDTLKGEYKAADATRQAAILDADKRISAWQQEVTGKPQGTKPAPLADTAEGSQVNRAIDISQRAKPQLRNPPSDPMAPPPPPGKAPDLMAEIRDAGPAKPDTIKPREGKPTDLPEYPRDVTPRAPGGPEDVISAADRELFNQQGATAQLKRATEGSDFMAEQFIKAKSEGSTPVPEDIITPRGVGRGPGQGPSGFGRKIPREQSPGGQAQYDRLGLPSPEDPMAPPSEPGIQEKIAQLEAENARLRQATPDPMAPPEAPQVYTSPKESPDVSRATVAELQRGLKEEAPGQVPAGDLTAEQRSMQERAAPVTRERPSGAYEAGTPEGQKIQDLTVEFNQTSDPVRRQQILDELKKPEPPADMTIQAQPTAPAPGEVSLRPAYKVNGEVRPDTIGQAGDMHGATADIQAKIFEEYNKNPKAEIESGWVDDKGRWFDNQEAAAVKDLGFVDLLKKGLGSEVGAVGRFTPEQLSQERLAREARREAYNRIAEYAKATGREMEEAAGDMRVTPTMFRRIITQHAMDQVRLGTDSTADTMTKLNQRAQVLEPEVGNVMATGHVSGEARPDLLAAWGEKKPLTYDTWVSQKYKDVNQNQLGAAGKALADARRVLGEYAKDDKTTALAMDDALKRFKVVEKEFNRLADQYSKISIASGRLLESRKRAPNPFPEDAIAELRRIGLKVDQARQLRERIPLDTNILHQLGRVLSERSVHALTGEEWRKTWSDAVNSMRFNLFSPPSAVLDTTLNGAELGAQASSGFLGDIVHVATGGRSLPNTSGMIKAIGIRRIGNYWPGEGLIDPTSLPEGRGPMFGRREVGQLQERLGHTFGGEAIPGNLKPSELVNKPQNWRTQGIFQTGKQGVFTRRTNQWNAAGDTVQGVLYSKAAVDTGAKNLAGNAVLYREAFDAADKAGLKGIDRHRFVDNFFANLPSGVLDEAALTADKAGMNRKLTATEEKIARSNIVKLAFDPFARFGFQFARWGGEMIGLNPTIFRKYLAGTLGPEEFGRYMGRTLTGWGGIYAIDRWYNNNPDGHVDYKSGEWVDNKTHNRQRISSFEPVMTGLLVGQMIKAGAAYGAGDSQAATEHFDNALGITRYASLPVLRSIYGDSGMIGGIWKQLQAMGTTGDTHRLTDELTDWANRAIPGQALLSFVKSVTDPTLREGFGGRLPGVSYLKDPKIDMATGGTIEPKQRISLPGFKEIAIDLPAIGGTPIPGAQRVVEPVAGLLSQYGLLEYRGPRMPVAGYRADEIPADTSREWQREFGRARSQILGQLLPTIRAGEAQAGTNNGPGTTFYENTRKRVAYYDSIAAKHATDIVNQRHLNRPKPARRPTITEIQRAGDTMGR